MYVAVKGGEKAIDAAHALLEDQRRGDRASPPLTLTQIQEQMSLAVDRVMAEGALFDRDLAALAIKQAQGDLVEAIFLLRAYRTTLQRFGHSEPLETRDMDVDRRISATFKDVPGGQVLGATFDYTHRLLDFRLMDEVEDPATDDGNEEGVCGVPPAPVAPVTSLLQEEGLLESSPPPDGKAPGDLTRDPLMMPAGRDVRLQNLARADEGFLLSLAYSTQRGFGTTHPFAGEIRKGTVTVRFTPLELGFPIDIGDIDLTECQMINQFKGSAAEPPRFTRGYGLAFGSAERKAMVMALVDRALRAEELGEDPTAPAQDIEFVLGHSDNVEGSGFVQHLKLPHYVDFQSELDMVRRLRAQWAEDQTKRETTP